MSTDHGDARATFDIVHETTPSETLLAGFSEFGLAGLTAVDYLVEQLGLEETGHVVAEELPAIAPFSNGLARHHTRLFSAPDVDCTVLVGERFVPLSAADSFASAVIDWTAGGELGEIVVLSGVPIAHGPAAHRTFYIATEDYQERRLSDLDSDGDTGEGDGDTGPDVGADGPDTGAGTDVGGTGAPRPMGNGYLSGINGALVSRGLDSSLGVCVLTTPVHARSPDVDAALRLLESVSELYDLVVDTGPLEEFAAGVADHYERLAEHVEDTKAETRYDDRMYM